MSRLSQIAVIAVASLLATSALAQSGKVTVVTSYAKDVTDPFKKAFEQAHPGTTLDVQNRNTNAGVKYVEETRSNNQVDIFWASAPDAFEVLASEKLLAKIESPAKEVPAKIGNYPINDPEGYYRGQALAGYGLMWNTRYLKANNLPEPREWADLVKPVYFGHLAISSPSRSISPAVLPNSGAKDPTSSRRASTAASCTRA